MQSVRLTLQSNYIDKPDCSVRGCQDFARVCYTRRIDGLEIAAYACNAHNGDVGMTLGDIAGAVEDAAMSDSAVNILSEQVRLEQGA